MLAENINRQNRNKLETEFREKVDIAKIQTLPEFRANNKTNS